MSADEAASEVGEEERTDAWFAARTRLLEAVFADRALAPASRHVLVELLLDGIDDARHLEADLDLGWSARLAARHRLTTRGVRKALAELASLGLVEHSRGDVRVFAAAAAERLCRGTNLPQDETAEHADPVRAHADRLGRLRDRAMDDGLVATAVAAERAIGRAYGFYTRGPRRFDDAPPDYAAMPAHERKGFVYNHVLPMLRDSFLLDPAYQDDVLAFIADFRKASGAGPPSSAQVEEPWYGGDAPHPSSPGGGGGAVAEACAT